MPSKVRTLPSRVQTLGLRVPRAPEAAPSYGQGRGGRPWRRLRQRILDRDANLCQPCERAGRVTTATEVDHIVNRAAGGTDDESNLQSICTPCHEAKTQQEARQAHSRG